MQGVKGGNEEMTEDWNKGYLEGRREAIEECKAIMYRLLVEERKRVPREDFANLLTEAINKELLGEDK